MIVCLAWVSVADAIDFTDIRPPDSSTTANFCNSGIAWRPQGDYALLVSTRIYYPTSVGVHRYVYDTGTLTYQAYVFPDYNFQRIEFSADGSYALITGDDQIYRYDHNASGFGTVTELIDIEDSGTCTISFYDVLRHPTDDSEPLYILANQACGSAHQVRIYRYDPAHTPQVYIDDSGGISPSDTSAFEPLTGAWQADGDYLVWGNRTNNGWHGGIFIWDPDHSTFPPNAVTDEMQFFADGGLTNISTVCTSPVAGTRFVMVKGTGRVVRFTEYPTTMVADYPSEWHTSISDGDSSYNSAGTTCIFVERQGWDPYHTIMLYDADGDVITIDQGVFGSGFTNQTDVHIYAVEWHPFLQMGLMAGGNRWIFRFEDDPIPTPATATPTVTATPTSEPSVTMTPTGTRTAQPTPLPLPAEGPASIAVGVFAVLFLLLMYPKHG